MKKLIALAVALIMILSLCACGGEKAPIGSEMTWGNISVFVPKGWTFTEGSLIDEQDPDALSIKDPDASLLTYINIIVDDEDAIDRNIQASKDINEGATDTTVKAGDKEWTGVTYESMGHGCGYLKHVEGDKVMAVYYCGYRTEDTVFNTILASIK